MKLLIIEGGRNIYYVFQTEVKATLLKRGAGVYVKIKWRSKTAYNVYSESFVLIRDSFSIYVPVVLRAA